MKKILFLFLFLILPVSVNAANIFNSAGSFDLAKAVKLGRGSAYSVAVDSAVNTGSGGTKIKECPANCADCDDSTSCNICKSGYGKNKAGECVACPSQCSQCIYNVGVGEMTCSGGCASGYHLEYNSTGTYSDCCPTNKILSDVYPYLCVAATCEAGTYRSGSNLCESCETGTYSNGSNVSACSDCSTLKITAYGSNLPCGDSCTATGTCTSCPNGYYASKSYTGNGEPTCSACPTGCSACSDSSMGVYCTACKSGYTMGSNSYGLETCIQPSCSAGFYLIGSNTCSACSSGTYSAGGTATSCSSCSNLFVGSNGGIKFTCLSCTTTGTCQTCGYNGSSSGYQISNGRCQYVGSASGSGSGSNSGSGSSSGGTGSCASGGATATNPTNCPQGYGWGGSGCVTSSSQCKVCSQGSSLGGYCNCPAGSPSDGRGGCGRSCSFPYSNYCSSGPQSGKCCKSTSDCYGSVYGNCI